MTGRIKNVSDKGFGFIMSNGEEYFFHRSGYLGNWTDLENMTYRKGHIINVTFDTEESKKGLRATNVKLV